MAPDLKAILEPRSIAIIGASSNPSKRGYQSVRALVTSGYKGDIYPVNPTETNIAGVDVYRSIADVPHDVDLALICTPAASLPKLIEECGRKGVKGAVILAGGFGESGEAGKRLQREVLEQGQRWKVRLIGPNTSGIFNLHQRINLVGFSKLSPGGIGILSQSGNMALALVTEAAQTDGIGFSSYIGVGNQIDLTHADYLDYFREDEGTNAVVAYIEGFKDGRSFLRAARRLCAAKPLIIYKGGRTVSGQRAALSHTGSLAQKFSLSRDLLNQHGAIVVTRTDELLPIADILTRCPVNVPRRVAILADGGGHATIVADELTEKEFELAELSPESERTLRQLLGPAATTVNPIDLAGAADAKPTLFADAARIILSDEAVDALLIVGLFGGYAIRFSSELLDEEVKTAVDLAHVARSFGKPLILHSLYANTATQPLKAARAAGVAVVDTIECAVAGLDAIREYGTFRARIANEKIHIESDDKSTVGSGKEIATLWSEPDAREFLRRSGIDIERHVLIREQSDLDEVLHVFGGEKLALKVVSPDIPHKSEAKGVILNVDASNVASAYGQVIANVRAYNRDAKLDGVLAIPMARPGVELIIGIFRDDIFGPLIMVGLGGIFVELFENVQFRALPITRDDALDMLGRLKNGAILDGLRGRENVDRDAIAALLVNVSKVAISNPNIVEIDLNPVIARSDGYTIVDTRIVAAPPAS